jgi:2'-5' RNA ligase
MQHVVVPLDHVHSRNARELAATLAREVGAPRAAAASPHVTVASFTGLPPAEAVAALRVVARWTEPFTVRAHGYGAFAGDAPSNLSLFITVVRTTALDRLHRLVAEALLRAGATLDGVTAASVWSPHVTLLDRHLTPRQLGRAVEALTCRPHRSWSLDVASLAVISRRDGLDPSRTVPLGPVRLAEGGTRPG